MSSFYRGFSVVARMPVSVSTTCAAYSGILGFTERVRGSHHIFRRGASPRESIWQRDDSHAKPYQVQQVRRVIVKYRLEEGKLNDV